LRAEDEPVDFCMSNEQASNKPGKVVGAVVVVGAAVENLATVGAAVVVGSGSVAAVGTTVGRARVVKVICGDVSPVSAWMTK